MKNSSLNAPLLLSALLSLPLGAAIIVDNPLGSVVDPAGAQTVDNLASGSVTVAAMNGTSGLKVIQDWSDISNEVDFTDIFSFTDPGTPDIRLTVDGNPASFSSGYNTGSGNKDSSLESSAGHFQIVSDNTNSITTLVTFEFGTWDGNSFSLATGTNGANAAGMTLPNYGAAFTDVTVQYRNTSGTVVSTQSFSGGGGDTTTGPSALDFFTGYISGSTDLQSVSLEFTVNNSGRSSGLDDFAFAAIPEPSSLALTAMAMLMGLGFLRKRRA